MTPEPWPTLPYDAWKDTYATLHMWSQIVGKVALARAAPINHSWGVAFDITARGLTTRTLPHGDRSFRVAYSHEVISHGFWPGSGPLLEPAFYAYAVPEPHGFKDASVQPDGAYYHHEIGEFILPYEAVRSAASPERAIMEFVDSTYARAATLANWDRAALETNPPPRDAGGRR